jgi:cardiolipin synthase
MHCLHQFRRHPENIQARSLHWRRRLIDPVDPLARIIHAPLRGLARVGFAPAARLSPAELCGSSYLLSCGVLGALWQARRGAPSWDEVSRTWERALDAGREPPPGRFDAADALTILDDNAAAFAARARLVARAQHSVDLATYYLQDDATGRAVARALAAAVARGVRVRLVADAFIMRKKEREGLGSLRLFSELRAAGVDARLWRDGARPYDTNHRKLLLVDGAALLLGGRNIADHYAGAAWRDVELLVEGPSAASALPLFERTFHGQPEPAPRPASLVQATTPAGLGAHANFLYLLGRVGRAERSVDIENAYFFAHPALRRALFSAVRRGVRARVFTNSAESNDLDFINHRLYAGLGEMLDAGVEVHLRRGRGRTLHAKYFVVDERWVSLGSSNLDYYSPRFCTEANVHADSPALAAGLGRFFERGIGEAERLTSRAEIDAVLAASPVARAVDTFLKDAQ